MRQPFLLSYLSPEAWSSSIQVNGRIKVALTEKNWAPFAQNKQRIFLCALTWATRWHASCVSVILLLSTGHVKNTFLLLPLVRSKHAQSRLCNQDCEMRAGSAPAGSFSSWWFKTFTILSRMWMLIFLSNSGNKGGSHPAKYVKWERILV